MKRGFEVTSRIGKKPILLPEQVTVSVAGSLLTITGPAGSETLDLGKSGFTVVMKDQQLSLTPNERHPANNMRSGLYRALIANAVQGVVTPFSQQLLLIGTGFRAEVSGNQLNLRVGYSHPVIRTIPEGLTVTVDKNTVITVTSRRKALVGQFAAETRSVRPPDAYKGKGIRYATEQVSLKPGKAAKAVGGAAA